MHPTDIEANSTDYITVVAV